MHAKLPETLQSVDPRVKQVCGVFCGSIWDVIHTQSSSNTKTWITIKTRSLKDSSSLIACRQEYICYLSVRNINACVCVRLIERSKTYSSLPFFNQANPVFLLFFWSLSPCFHTFDMLIRVFGLTESQSKVHVCSDALWESRQSWLELTRCDWSSGRLQKTLC